MTAVEPCKFHLYGHCKFGSSCRHLHTQHTCTNTRCNKSSCTSRHPRPCIYFTRSGHCKFGTACSYLHVTNAMDSEVEKMKKDLEQTVSLLKAKENEIKMLEERVGKLESQLNKPSCASSENQVRPNAQLNMHKEITHTQPIKCEFWTCDYEASSSTVLKRHITMKHKIDESFVYPSSTEEDECVECGHVFTVNLNFAMHLYKEHKYGFSCAHCHKYLPGDDLMFQIHLKLCTSPCDGDPRCPCKILDDDLDKYCI